MFWNWFGYGRNPDARRCIFSYRDGTRVRRADPVAVESALIGVLGTDWRGRVRRLAKPPEILAGLVGEQAQAADAEREDLRRKVLSAIDAAFGVHAYTDHGGAGRPTGLMEWERFGLLEGFLLFCTDLVEMARPFVKPPSLDSPRLEDPPPASGPAYT